MTTGRDIRFWRNVVLIALAHVALIVGLIRWSVAARASTNAESIVWLGSAEDLAARENKETPSTQLESHAVEPRPPKDEPEEEKPAVAQAKSEIELPSPTPKPTPKPKPSSTPTPKPKVTPRATSKPASKKILLAKASPKPSKPKPSPGKSTEKSEKNEKNLTRKTGTASQSSSEKTASTGKGGSAGGGTSPAAAGEFGWYGHMLHDRFYSAWIQPTTSVPSGSKISALVVLRIEKDGRVSKFEVIKPSENVVVNESVAAIAKRVTEVDAPPAGLIKGDHYDVKINFELNTEKEIAK